MAIIAGIDPGFSGAIALLDPATKALTIHDMPVVKGANGKTITDFFGLATALVPNGDGPHVAMMEKVSAMPRQGVSSTFRFGENFGAVQMAVAGHGYEYHYVTPAKWKQYFHLSRDKGVSRSLAMQRFPDYADKFSRVKDDGRAEAALIALYAYETVKLP